MGAPILETNNVITPEISVKSTNPDVTSTFSDCDSSDERSLSSKASEENFRPTHHNLLTPQLKRSASASSFSSYASSLDIPETDNTVKNLTEENSLALGEPGVLAHNWYGKGGGSIRADGRWFKDEQGRVCLMRGVNLCGNSKLPTKPNGSSHLIEGFFDHRNVSFVGRPFDLKEVHEHFARLRTWGLTFVRLLVTWEALEHFGPGIYDEEFIDYLINVIEEMPRYGIKCFIDPHQDCWSRFSGGSGAPGWTFEVAGLDMKKFKETGAAYVHNTNHQPGDSLPMVWPTNYTKLASSTMFTLFWGGDVFAPNSLYDGVNVKEFLQEKYVNCYKHLARRVQHLEAVMGFELMNEPHPGYIGLSDFHRYDAGTTLVFGDSPNALQSFALGDGITQEVEVWIRSWPFPTRKHSTRLVNEEGTSTWINGECIWKKHGVWDIDSKTGKPRILNTDYFKKHPKTGENVNFYKDFYLPFVRRYSEAIQSVKSDYLSFVEPIPNEPPPIWAPSDHHENIVYAPHWYDLESLFKKAFNGRITHDVQRLTRGPQHIVSATYFGISGAKKNYFGQVQNIVKNGLENVGGKPCVIGECGIPMDINDKKAFETGDYTHHINFLDAVLSAMEKNLVNFTLWNYNPSNDNAHGDHWYGEDFSIFSPLPSKPVVLKDVTTTTTTATTVTTTNSHSLTKLKIRTQNELSIKTSMIKDQVCAECTTTSPTSPFNLNSWEFMDQEKYYDPSHHAGGRVLDAVLRPYAAKVPGIPQTMVFNLKTKEFIFKFTNFPSSQPINNDFASIVAPEAEIFIPNYHYKKLGLDIRVSDGDWRYVRSGQTLYWRVKDWSTEGLVHSLRIRIVDDANHKTMPTAGSVKISDDSKNTFDSNEFKHYNTSVILVLVVTLFLAMCSPTEIMFWAMGRDI